MARRPQDVPPDRVVQLNRGLAESSNLAEGLAIDLAELARAVCPDLPRRSIDRLRAVAGEGITRRMPLAASLFAEHLGPEGAVDRLAAHPSDTARGWACYAVAASTPELGRALGRIRPLAADGHYAVREWAWMALRGHVIAQTGLALELLEPWTIEPDANIRRYAVELTRPRGVWCSHLRALREDPAPARAMLEGLRDDPSKYVQDSVANWLNDAAKDHPQWVRGLVARWLEGAPTPQARRIARRATRSIDR